MNFGIYRFHEPLDPGELTSLENNYGTDIKIISVYRAWKDCDIDKDLHWLNTLKTSSRQILLTWEPWKILSGTVSPYDQNEFSLRTILSGKYDNYIRSFIRHLETFPDQVFLRIMHEMNGNWYPWCGTVNNNSPELFIDTWNHIRKIAGSDTLSHITWVWCPYAHSYPDNPDNSIEKYFPGDDAADIIAIDGYNWGQSMDWSVWQSFDEIFSAPYKIITSMSNLPLIIAEVASTESGGDKGQWITEAFHSLRSHYPGIKTLIWFDTKKECDWRIKSSAASLKAFRASANIFS